MKQYIRKRTDQSHNKMIQFISVSRRQFINNDINLNLIRRFWSFINAYKNGSTYEEGLKTYYNKISKQFLIK